MTRKEASPKQIYLLPHNNGISIDELTGTCDVVVQSFTLWRKLHNRYRAVGGGGNYSP
jgi:hypothetical protein